MNYMTTKQFKLWFNLVVAIMITLLIARQTTAINQAKSANSVYSQLSVSAR